MGRGTNDEATGILYGHHSRNRNRRNIEKLASDLKENPLKGQYYFEDCLGYSGGDDWSVRCQSLPASWKEQTRGDSDEDVILEIGVLIKEVQEESLLSLEKLQFDDPEREGYHGGRKRYQARMEAIERLSAQPGTWRAYESQAGVAELLYVSEDGQFLGDIVA